jgi:hypothetical protein
VFYDALVWCVWVRGYDPTGKVVMDGGIWLRWVQEKTLRRVN